MKDEVRAVFAKFQAQGLVFADMGNDAFLAICDDPVVLWDAAVSIRVRGEGLVVPGQAFAGTRKGLYFGSVAVVQTPTQGTLIRDVRIPNTIPRSFIFSRAWIRTPTLHSGTVS